MFAKAHIKSGAGRDEHISGYGRKSLVCPAVKCMKNKYVQRIGPVLPPLIKDIRFKDYLGSYTNNLHLKCF